MLFFLFSFLDTLTLQQANLPDLSWRL